MKKIFLRFLRLSSIPLSNVLTIKWQTPQNNIISNGILASLFAVSFTDHSTVLAYSSAAGLTTSYSINWINASNNTGMRDQSTTNCTFSLLGGTINGFIVTGGTPSGFYEGIITIVGCCISSNHTSRFRLICIPTVGYITILHKNVLLKSERLGPTTDKIFTLAIA